MISTLQKWLRLWRTLRYLRASQLFGRIWFRLNKPKPNCSAPPALASPKVDSWIVPPSKAASFVAPSQFSFLNQTQAIVNATDWNNENWDKLWLYNLHYFDFLNAPEVEKESSIRAEWIARWIRDNPPGAGNGWEPYPTSLRIVNWIKWHLQGNPLESIAQHSLAVQVRYLGKRIEYHLLGNHLFANIKALVFAGLFFKGKEAETWLSKGLTLLCRELKEQILKDGGHFERSPMYHAIILEDVLDMINLFQTYASKLPAKWQAGPDDCRRLAPSMMTWLSAMSHPDGNFGLFNDAAFGIAAAPDQLKRYCISLGISKPLAYSKPVVALEDSGYLRFQSPNMVALLDVGEIGPSYLPGHAHADTLSFEMSVFGQRVLVNSGTSCYGLSQERLRQRGTAAHNTITIDGENSSEVWSGFRVARRAHPVELSIREQQDEVAVTCAHDGYHRLKGKPTHRRTWLLENQSLVVKDFIENNSGHKAIAYFHFHPALELEASDNRESGVIKLPNGKQVAWSIIKGQARLSSTTYHPEFGISLKNQSLEVELLDANAEIIFNWN